MIRNAARQWGLNLVLSMSGNDGGFLGGHTTDFASALLWKFCIDNKSILTKLVHTQKRMKVGGNLERVAKHSRYCMLIKKNQLNYLLG